MTLVMSGASDRSVHGHSGRVNFYTNIFQCIVSQAFQYLICSCFSLWTRTSYPIGTNCSYRAKQLYRCLSLYSLFSYSHPNPYYKQLINACVADPMAPNPHQTSKGQWNCLPKRTTLSYPDPILPLVSTG